MKVELLNPTQIKLLYYNWGQVAQVCYASGMEANLEKIGKHCQASGHYSGSRGDFFKFYVTDVPRACMDQIIRAEEGVFKNCGSFRYINESGFAYEVPATIKDNPTLMKKYDLHMSATAELYKEIQAYVQKKTNKIEIANQSARYVLPMSTHTAFVIGFDLEALIHLCNIRLCSRAEDFSQEFARQCRDEALKVLPELKPYLVPNCEALMYCPDGEKCCGRYPTKEVVQEILKKNLKNNT